MYGIDGHTNKDRKFTIGDDKNQKYAFLPFNRKLTVNEVSQVNLALEKLKSKQLNDAEVSLHLNYIQEDELSTHSYDHKEPLVGIIGHKSDIILNIKRPYPPVLRRPAYPASPK
ncbi:hypothetical protein O181_023784 [Austropuccinia psidii MF-1]|uniref:Uncharacterized protein n=1 Tax=Austropuccinia psidii MF-1 TaxID=1389203 RepID=A0A9Q3CHD1_9BASI|nr:hypothetical protein [Austropuccinia psidii MF-1]